MILDEPYFMTNDKWYHFDANKKTYVIEDSAPEEAKKSYEEYYKIIDVTK